MKGDLKPQQVAVILIPFGLLVVVGMVLVIGKTGSEPAGGSESRGRASANNDKARLNARMPVWLRNAEAANYDELDHRAMFGAVKIEQKSARTDLPPLPVLPGTAAPAGPATPPRPEGPAADRIAVVGMVRINGETLAVVEDLSRSETRFVPVGGEAYGYRVLSVGHHEATLTKNGRQYALAVGENKPEPRQIRRPEGGPGGPGGPGQGAPAFAGGPQPGQNLGDFFRNMTDEQRQAFRDRMRTMSDEERRAMFEQMRSGAGGGGEGGGNLRESGNTRDGRLERGSTPQSGQREVIVIGN